MTEKPFIHKQAFDNVKSNFIFHEDIVKIFLKLIDKKGVVNVGGKTQTIYKFAKKFNKNIKNIKSKGQLPLNMSMSLDKLEKFLR